MFLVHVYVASPLPTRINATTTQTNPAITPFSFESMSATNTTKLEQNNDRCFDWVRTFKNKNHWLTSPSAAPELFFKIHEERYKWRQLSAVQPPYCTGTVASRCQASLSETLQYTHTGNNKSPLAWSSNSCTGTVLCHTLRRKSSSSSLRWVPSVPSSVKEDKIMLNVSRSNRTNQIPLQWHC